MHSLTIQIAVDIQDGHSFGLCCDTIDGLIVEQDARQVAIDQAIDNLYGLARCADEEDPDRWVAQQSARVEVVEVTVRHPRLRGVAAGLQALTAAASIVEVDEMERQLDLPVNRSQQAVMPPTERLLSLARLSMMLGEVERVPTHPDGRHETDTTHTVMLALIAAEVAAGLGLDPGRAALLALVHDLPEAICGDVDTSLGLDADARERKARREADALLGITRELGDDALVTRLLREYAGRASDEAALVHLMDKAMPKAVRVVGREMGCGPALTQEQAQAAQDQRVRLREEHPGQEWAPLHGLLAELLERLAATGVHDVER